MWTFLPAGWRAHRKVEQIIREELDAIGCGEMLMPVLQPAELWKQTGRYDIDELFKLKDRRGAELVLAMTHEENLTFHMAREVRSYRDLPKLLYHFQTKERDEPRPRAGLLRTREFIMKDAYSFDRDAGGARRAPTSSSSRPTTASSTAPGSSGTGWSRDVGMMGGFGAHEYMAPCAAGENDVALSDAGLRGQRGDRERRAAAGGRPAGAARTSRSEVETPGATTIEAVCGLLGVPAGALDQGVPGDRRRSAARCSWWSAATTASTRSSSRTRSARPSAPAEAEEVRDAVRRRAGLHRPGRRAACRCWPTRRCAACAGWWRAATSPTST